MNAIKLIFYVYLALLLGAKGASSHDMYAGTTDPVFNYEGCCGGNDCSTIPASWVFDEGDGVRIVMTLEQSRQVNSSSTMPIDAFIPEKRIKPSPDMEFHACIFHTDRSGPRAGVICFWGFRGV